MRHPSTRCPEKATTLSPTRISVGGYKRYPVLDGPRRSAPSTSFQRTVGPASGGQSAKSTVFVAPASGEAWRSTTIRTSHASSLVVSRFCGGALDAVEVIVFFHRLWRFCRTGLRSHCTQLSSGSTPALNHLKLCFQCDNTGAHYERRSCSEPDEHGQSIFHRRGSPAHISRFTTWGVSTRQKCQPHNPEIPLPCTSR